MIKFRRLCQDEASTFYFHLPSTCFEQASCSNIGRPQYTDSWFTHHPQSFVDLPKLATPTALLDMEVVTFIVGVHDTTTAVKSSSMRLLASGAITMPFSRAMRLFAGDCFLDLLRHGQEPTRLGKARVVGWQGQIDDLA